MEKVMHAWAALSAVYLFALAALASAPVLAQDLILPAGTPVDVGFSPNGGAEAIVLNAIGSARSSVLMSAYTFTNRRISDALQAAERRGVKVAIVADLERNKQPNGELRYLAEHGIPVRVNGNFLDKHSKYLIIDQMSVETGSFNYSSASALKNEENVLWLHNVPQLAKVFTEEWQSIWQGGQNIN